VSLTRCEGVFAERYWSALRRSGEPAAESHGSRAETEDTEKGHAGDGDVCCHVDLGIIAIKAHPCDIHAGDGRSQVPPPEVEACNVNRSKRIVWEPPAAAVTSSP
jgi:hypothetical protein